MSNKIFFDSSLLIEYRNGNHILLFENLVGDSGWNPCISQIVVSEYLFHHLAIFGGKAPLTIKTSNLIGGTLMANDPDLFLEQFEYLVDTPNLKTLCIKLMEKYNLLPNDALIISICKFYEIKFLASLDSDFRIVCHRENIKLISSVLDSIFPDLSDSPL